MDANLNLLIFYQMGPWSYHLTILGLGFLRCKKVRWEHSVKSQCKKHLVWGAPEQVVNVCIEMPFLSKAILLDY